MCGFDIRCAAGQETEVNGTGNHLLIIWDIGLHLYPIENLHATDLQHVNKGTFDMLNGLYLLLQRRAKTTLTSCNFATVASPLPTEVMDI